MRQDREEMPPALILQGTVDIARPIYWGLRSKIIPVYYIIFDQDPLAENISADSVIKIEGGNLDENSIKRIMERTGKYNKKLIVFPTNEISLNKSQPLATYDDGKRFHIPGRIAYPRRMDAFGITNKDSFYENTSNLLSSLQSEKFKLAKSSILRKEDNLDHFASAIDYYPVTVKPARKNLSDSFMRSLKAKLLVALNPQELVTMCKALFKSFDIPFLVQEKIDCSEEFTWGGMRKKGYCLGAVQIERIKLPRLGGTGVLTEIMDNVEIEKLATDILNLLDFEGICEIGFLVKNNAAYFTFEMNPRGWLQVDILFSMGLDIYSSYYYLFNELPCSFDKLDLSDAGRKKVFWASVDRYVALAAKPSVMEALRMLKYDISLKYDKRNRTRAALGLIRRVLGKRIKGLRGSDKTP
jgi:hypothetical protein